MESNYRTYNHAASADRIRAILNQSDINYTEVDSLPDRDKLTYNNGFYANCTAVFIDIRGSSKLPDKYKRPTLARIYRAYISEVVAVMNGSINCTEVNIIGDGAWGVFDTPYTTDIDEVFSTMAQLHSMINILNKEFRRKGIEGIEVGIGASWGRALVIKAGYSGSGISDVVYMGDVVNAAAKLAANGNKTYGDKPIMVSNVFYSNLNDHNSGLMTKHWNYDCYHGNIVNTAMEEWIDEKYE